MKTVKELHEQKAALAKEIESLAERHDSGEWNAETEQRWQTVNDEYNRLDKSLEIAKAAERARAFSNEQVIAGDGITREEIVDASFSRHLNRKDENIVTPEDRANAFLGWARAKAEKPLTPEQVRALDKVGKSASASAYDFNLVGGEYRTIRDVLQKRTTDYQSTAAGFGGTTVPEGFVYNFEKALLAFGSVRQVADVVRTSGVGDLPWPTANDTSNKGSQIDEVQDSTDSGIDSTPVAMSSITWKAFNFTSDIIRVSYTLLDDTAFNLQAELASMAGERIARITEDRFTNGNGTTQPQGIAIGATLGHVAASVSAIDANELLDLEHSVDPAYRAGGRVGFMMHDNVLKVLRKLRDSDGRSLWQNSLSAGEPQTLAGYPIFINQEMPNTLAATERVMVFGDLSKYKIRDVSNFRLLLSEHRYMEFDQLAVVAHSRHDGRILNAGTNPIKYLAMAAS